MKTSYMNLLRQRWANMKQRCYNPKDRGYKNYGARGITVCERWRNSFPEFLKDMGHPPSPNHSIDRIKNNLGYSPENCKWSTLVEQHNNYRQNVILAFDGQRLTATQWANKLGIEPRIVLTRLKKGWPVNRILTEPVANRSRRRAEFITFNGISMTVSGWSQKTGVSYAAISKRLQYGWPLERILSEKQRPYPFSKK